MTRIAYLVTSAREMTLADGTAHPTGYFAEEALKPYERFTDAGFDVTVITPDGNPPYADPYGSRSALLASVFFGISASRTRAQ